MNKIALLQTEINMIQNESYKKNIEALIKEIPDYFFEDPASSTGKYHPSFSQNEGGLLRHTKVATRIANELLSLESYKNIFTERERDLLKISIILHDSIKSGNPKEKYTRFDHPLLAVNFVEENKLKTSFNNEEIRFIKDAISSHMGEWNTNMYSNVILPKPQTKYQIFVHTCDFLSSKKFLDVKFENNEII